MGPGVAAVRLRNSVQERTTQRGGSRFVKAATTGNASRDQGTSAAEASAACSWILEMREKIRTQSQKYADYVMEGNCLYMCPESSTGNGAEGETRLTSGWPCRKSKDNSTRPGMHRDARAHV